MAISTSRDEVLITYSLGSCVGLTLFDPVACVGGLIHCMLPLSRIDKAKAKANPCMFTDTGVVLLLTEMLRAGASRENLISKVAGAASVLDHKGLFKIGERNHTVLRRVLWKNNIMVAAEDVGGTIARTVSLHMATGETYVKSQGKESLL